MNKYTKKSVAVDPARCADADGSAGTWGASSDFPPMTTRVRRRALGFRRPTVARRKYVQGSGLLSRRVRRPAVAARCSDGRWMGPTQAILMLFIVMSVDGYLLWQPQHWESNQRTSKGPGRLLRHFPRIRVPPPPEKPAIHFQRATKIPHWPTPSPTLPQRHGAGA